MRRPLADKRPIGPFRQMGGTGRCMLRFKVRFDTRQMPTESMPSLEQSILREVSEVVSVDNLNVITGEGRYIEAGMDILPRQLSGDDEDQLLKAIGRAIIDGGAVDPDVEMYQWSVVSR